MDKDKRIKTLIIPISDIQAEQIEKAKGLVKMGAEQALKRIPRIKFPQRHPKPSPSGSISETQATRKDGGVIGNFIARSRLSSDVPAPPSNTAVGGKASLLPKRTPVSEREIEAILLGGCF